ncbi:hypothetical protein [Gandjariella thermophila]|uniref:Uncharacterized protein n=1 Tax=Gandjariella thermophila TaxID=1931992 RepID=A0A4D4JB91_9PSEU|nr:hypothetical protein [Gandjariella thermophila]GDY31103.1 hypothetical protein GTS_27360 [Gandjariella thermophila]
MEARDLVAALKRLQPVDSLATDLLNVREQAKKCGLLIFPAAPENPKNEVHIGPEDMDWPDFVDYAVRLQAGLLYVDATIFHAEEALAETEEEGSAVRKALARFEGFTDTLSLMFVHGGAWHHWSTLAGFAQLLARAADEAEFGYGGETKLAPDEADRITAELLSDPEFRAARSFAAMHRVLQARHPRIAERDWPGSPVRIVVMDAVRSVFRDRRDHEQRLRQQLPALAEELATSNQFLATASDAMRKEVAGDFLTGKADGHPMPTALRNELAVLAYRASRRNS